MFNRIKNLRNLIGSTFSSSRARIGSEFLLRETDFGKIYLEADVIRRYVEHTKVDGVHEVKNVVVDSPTEIEPLKIKLNLVIGQDYSAPKVGANLRDEIKVVLREKFGITDALFDIRVTQITQTLPEPNKRRVR